MYTDYYSLDMTLSVIDFTTEHITLDEDFFPPTDATIAAYYDETISDSPYSVGQVSYDGADLYDVGVITAGSDYEVTSMTADWILELMHETKNLVETYNEITAEYEETLAEFKEQFNNPDIPPPIFGIQGTYDPEKRNRYCLFYINQVCIEIDLPVFPTIETMPSIDPELAFPPLTFTETTGLQGRPTAIAYTGL